MTDVTSDSTSSSLLTRVRRRDGAAWNRLTVLYGPLVYHWARRANLQAEDAADIVQEVFQAVMSSIGSYEEHRKPGKFRGWLWGITKHKLADHFRNRASRPEAIGGTHAQQHLEELPETPPEDADDATSAESTGGLVQRALGMIQTDFSAHVWQAFLRTTAEGHAPQQVADDLRMSVAAVYKAKSRVLARLREEMSGLEQVAGPLRPKSESARDRSP